MSQVQFLQHGNRDFTPGFNHARQQVRIVDIKGPVESDREGNRLIGIIDLHCGQMGIRQRRQELVVSKLRQVNAKIEQQIGKLNVVDGCQRIELENARYGIRILKLR